MLNKITNHIYIFLQRVYRKLYRIFGKYLRIKDIDINRQSDEFIKLGLDRSKGLDLLNSILQLELNKKFDESDGMFSEHLVLLAAIAIKINNIKSILEIGTYDGKTALILCKLFPNAEITTIDLPESTDAYSSTYNRSHNIENFVKLRNKYISTNKKISFLQMNSISLCNENEREFDLIWIDGAHGYPVIAMDIINAFRLCSKNGYILIDDVWKKLNISDKYYKSIGAFESLLELKEAMLIKEFHLIPKRLGLKFNYPWEKKFIGLINKK